MTETKQRIQDLKSALPHVREKVATVAMLFVLSLVLMVSTSYAWYTISVNPELGGVNTTVSANGNLEIALSDFDGKEPDASGVTDSLAAENQTTHGANITWGNLVNISSGYGVESLVLRPAKFDPQSTTYLFSAQYGGDGRVETLTSNFAFTSWEYNETLKRYEFAVPTKEDEKGNTVLADAYGVRAISTVMLGDVASAMDGLLAPAEAKCEDSAENYLKVMGNTDYMAAIKQVIQVYLNYNMYEVLNRNGMGFLASGRNNSEITAYAPTLLNLYTDFYEKAVLKFGDALAEVANLQMSLNGVGGDKLTTNDLIAMSVSELSAKKVDLGSTLTTFKKLEKTVRSDKETLKAYLETHDKVYLDPKQAGEQTDTPEKPDYTLYNIINNLINIDAALIDGQKVSALMGSGTTAMGYINGINSGDTIEVVVTKGAVYDYEALAGEHMDMTISGLDMIIKNNLKGHLTTNAQGRMFSNVISLTKNMDMSYAGNIIADDTYGMVLDLWFRTNSKQEFTESTTSEDGVTTTTSYYGDTVLTLDGLPQIRYSYPLRYIIPAGESESTLVYTHTRNTGMELAGRPMTEDILVFRRGVDFDGDGSIELGVDLNKNGIVDTGPVDLNGDGIPDINESEIPSECIFVDCASYEPVYIMRVVKGTDENGNETTKLESTGEYINDTHVTPKTDVQENIEGFTSSNRITMQEESGPLEPDAISASQGSGSCYIFYADTPEQADSALELLSHMKLAFVDTSGVLTAQGAMDVARVYAQGGKYIVPLVITDSEYVTKNIEGKEILGITGLKQNVSTRISVIVYLEGEGLENSMVMSREAIVGSLNLQFSTAIDLRSVTDSAVAMDTISLRAEMENADSSDANGYYKSFNYDGAAKSAKITAYVEGLTPAKVEAVFQRRINATQGKQMESIEFTHESGDIWSANCTFAKPGTYVLSSLRVDGVDYDLPAASNITIVVVGFAVRSVSFCEAPGTEMALTTDSFVTRDITIEFEADLAVQPTTVEARFTTEDGLPVSATLRRNGQYWTGTARFTASGTYKLRYLVLDGEYEELPIVEATNDWKTFIAYLGLRTQVQLVRYINVDGMQLNNLNIVLEDGFDYNANPVLVEIYADILTNTGAALPGFEDVVLNYYKRGTSVNEAALSANLKWKNQQYYGVFPVSAVGAYNFANLQIGTANTITNVTQADTISVRSISPVSYIDSDTPALQILRNNTATYSANLRNADVLTGATAVFTNPAYENGREVLVNLPANSEEVIFAIPKGNGDIQNGAWTVKELRVSGVYDEHGYYYDCDPVTGEKTDDARAAYYTLPVGEEYVVVSSIDLKEKPVLVELGKDAQGNRTKLFMEAHSLSGLTDYGFTISIPGFVNDGKDLVIEGVKEKNVTLVQALAEKARISAEMKMIHNTNSSSEAGGYVFNTQGASYSSATFDLASSGEGRWIIPSTTTASVQHAGTYGYETVFTLLDDTGGKIPFTYTSTAAVLKVYSKAPYVKFTATNPAVGTEFDGANEEMKDKGDVVKRKNQISDDQYSVTVYFKASGDNCNCTGFTASKATATLYDMGVNFSEASCEIISNGEGANVIYQFTPEELSNERAIGSSSGTDRYGVGEKAEGKALIVKASDGKTYTFELVNKLYITATL